MLICYTNLMQLDPEQHGEKCRFMLSNSEMQAGLLVSLDTNDFHAEYKDGRAGVNLTRHLTNDQARELGKKLIEAADANEKLAGRWTTVMTSTTPEGNVVSVVK
jgi:hypothetical protein